MAFNLQNIIDTAVGDSPIRQSVAPTQSIAPTGRSVAPPKSKPSLSEEVSSVIDTDVLESGVGDFKAPETPQPSRFETGVPELDTTEVDEARDAVAEGIRSLGEKREFTEEAEEDAGLQEKRVAKTAIDNRIRRKERDLDLAIRAEEDKFGTRAQKNVRIRELTKGFNRELADLSIIQLARAGEFNDAQAQVNRKVELEFEDRQTELDALNFLFEENKERFSLVESRAFAKKIQEEQRAFDEDKEASQNLEDFKLDMLENAMEGGAGNATLEAIQRAETMEDVLKVPSVGQFAEIGADGTVTKKDKPMSINQIDTFRRSFGWTPPFGFTENELLDFMEDNPLATPEELEAGAKQMLVGEGGAPVERATVDEVKAEILSGMTASQKIALKKKADDAGESSAFKTARVDIKNYLTSIEDKIQKAIDAGHDAEAIIKFLTE